MSVLDKYVNWLKPKKPSASLTSRADVFKEALDSYISEGLDRLEAAKKAKEYADIVAGNIGMPEKTFTPENIIQQAAYYNAECQKHLGFSLVDGFKAASPYLLTFFGGLAAGKQVEEAEIDHHQPPPPIVYDED